MFNDIIRYITSNGQTNAMVHQNLMGVTFFCVICIINLLNLLKADNTICQYKLTDLNGYIKSPGYPKPYSHALNCSWQIIVPLGRKIKLQTEIFDVETSYNCERDALYIYDGPNEKSKLYSKPFCYSKGPKNVVSSGNALFLRFITDELDNGQGFSIKYTSFKICDYEFRQSRGSFTSPNFPSNYNANANCSYRIIVQKGKAVIIRFEDFALENKAQGECLDYVKIYDVIDGAPKLKKTLCGKGIPQPIQTVSNVALVKFHSDALIDNRGFNATFQSIYHLCGRNEFKCGNGRCINVAYLCNQVNDCFDNTDEAFCSCTQFSCKNKRCISHSLECNGENNCGDWSDEKHCQVRTNPYTQKTLWRGGSTTKSPALKTTTPLPIRCKYDEYQCVNKKCIVANSRCNGNDDCGDNSDESDCFGQCKNLNGGCEHECDYDRKTGVQCSCYEGFQLDSDGKSCIDVNECSARPCAEFCKNTYGSYQCECKQGYRVAPDRHNCTDFDECTQRGHCEQLCINSIGSFKCACYDGYTYDKEQNRCLDVNECDINNGGCAEKCVNSYGSYNCECHNDGYALVTDNQPCEEVNECELGTAYCEQLCINTNGSYRCDCKEGYHLDYDNVHCRDIDECQIGVPGCFGDCINTLGSYYCKCDDGFRPIVNNTKCEDVNECNYRNGGCSDMCINSKGSFECRCHKGYVKRDPRSFTCEDRDECTENICDGECINLPGSFLCRCDDGYELVNKTKCIDINECLDDEKNGCENHCTNTPGGFFCTCPDGFMLGKDQMKCVKMANATGCRRLKVNTKSISETSWIDVTEGWAWQVSLRVDFSYFALPRFNCIGVLVSNEFVLTTGHCVRFGRYVIIEAEKLVLTFGSYLRSRGSINIKAREIIFHKTLDIALIRLSKAVKLSKRVQPICLPQGEYDVDTSINAKLVAVTWPPENMNFQNLRHMHVSVTKTESCNWIGYSNKKDTNSMCVNFAIKTHILPMSGAPLLGILRGSSLNQKKQKWILTGFLIRGQSYPDKKKVFLQNKNVSYLKASCFVDWIRSTIEKSKND